tara:strand:- start:1083 stop:1424 length:342 start_codon:yes stop_codon:yes gene_type:complete
MKIHLIDICCGRSGDKGPNSNVGLVFYNEDIYNWAKDNLKPELLKKYFSTLVKGNIVRYELDNIYALNFILYDSLGGGGSESLLNDAQGKTHAQTLLSMEIDFPEKLKDLINE